MITFRYQMLKRLFKKVQKILISIEIVHFCIYYIIRPVYTFFIFLKHISKAIKILFNFFHSE